VQHIDEPADVVTVDDAGLQASTVARIIGPPQRSPAAPATANLLQPPPVGADEGLDAALGVADGRVSRTVGGDNALRDALRSSTGVLTILCRCRADCCVRVYYSLLRLVPEVLWRVFAT
jgi:hypothetical protein